MRALYALILAVDESKPIGITRNASAVAVKRDKKADYHSDAGRRALLAGTYPLAWGDKSVMVDAFIIGRITLAADYKASTITLRTFSRNESKPAELARIKSLVIPPAWTGVWICSDARGHLQATGRDARGR